MTNNSRIIRYEGRHALRLVTTVPRCASCGRVSVLKGGRVGMRRTQAGVVGYAGLATCGRVWLCPVCNAKIMATRSIEVAVTLAWAEAQQLSLVWGSLTSWHNSSSRLSGLFDVQGAAWRRVVNSRSWRGMNATGSRAHLHDASCKKKECGISRDVFDKGTAGRVGYLRALELNHGANGWHPHFHPLLFVRDENKAHDVADIVSSDWVDAVRAEGGRAQRNGAQQLRVLSPVQLVDELSGYVTKATYDKVAIARETTWSQGKTGRGRDRETSSHWTILAGIAQGLADDVELWHEVETATPGRRVMTWSRGLRNFAGIGAERDDEAIAAEEVGTDDDTVCFLTAEGWRAIREQPTLQAELLNILEAGGWAGLRATLDAHGIAYDEVAFSPV